MDDDGGKGATVVALSVSAGGFLIYVLSDGSEVQSTIKVTGLRRGEQVAITPRRLSRYTALFSWGGAR